MFNYLLTHLIHFLIFTQKTVVLLLCWHYYNVSTHISSKLIIFTHAQSYTFTFITNFYVITRSCYKLCTFTQVLAHQLIMPTFSWSHLLSLVLLTLLHTRLLLVELAWSPTYYAYFLTYSHLLTHSLLFYSLAHFFWSRTQLPQLHHLMFKNYKHSYRI